MVFWGICSGDILHGITLQLAGIEIPVTSVGDKTSAFSLLASFGFKITETFLFENENTYKILVVTCEHFFFSEYE